jgi:anthrone oxygenase-like protein
MFLTKWISLLTLALLTGGWTMSLLVMVPAQQRLSASVYTEVAQSSTAFGQQYFPILTLSSIALLVVLLLLGRKSGQVRTGFIAASLALLVGAAALTAATILPLNATINTWSIQSPPDDWQTTRDAWRDRHRIRTALAVSAFLLLSAGLLSPRRQPVRGPAA